MAFFEVDHWLPRQCLLCGQRAGDRNLCGGCLTDLPWIRAGCARCGCPLPAGVRAGACGHCRLSMRHIDRVIAALVYEYPVRQLVAAAKFAGRQETGHTLGLLLAAALDRRSGDLARPDCLLPVPLHRWRLARRGYNQAADIAAPISRALGIPVLHGRVCRQRQTAPQSDLGPRERRRNMRGAFAVSGTVAGNSIALIDDVVTTGHTTDALAAALRGAGARQVQVWAAAVAWKV